MSMLMVESVTAQPLISVSEFAWLGLSPYEQTTIQSNYVVSLLDQNSIGLIIDNQGVDESTNATTTGAQLGGAVASATYIDKAIRGGNYSATNQLFIGILGAVIGSTLDSSANTKYHYRYAVKFGSGDIKYFDEVKSDAFRHSIGVCVSVPNVVLVEQKLCNQTAASLRLAYLPASATKSVAPISQSSPAQLLPAIQALDFVKSEKPEMLGSFDGSSPKVNCKLGTLAPVRTTVEKCQLINGSQVQ